MMSQPSIGAESTCHRAFFIWAAILSLVSDLGCAYRNVGVLFIVAAAWEARQRTPPRRVVFLDSLGELALIS